MTSRSGYPMKVTNIKQNQTNTKQNQTNIKQYQTNIKQNQTNQSGYPMKVTNMKQIYKTKSNKSIWLPYEANPASHRRLLLDRFKDAECVQRQTQEKSF